MRKVFTVDQRKIRKLSLGLSAKLSLWLMSIYNTPSSCVRVGTNLFLGFKCIEVPFKFVYWIKAFCLCQEPQFKQNKIITKCFGKSYDLCVVRVSSDPVKI